MKRAFCGISVLAVYVAPCFISDVNIHWSRKFVRFIKQAQFPVSSRDTKINTFKDTLGPVRMDYKLNNGIQLKMLF